MYNDLIDLVIKIHNGEKLSGEEKTFIEVKRLQYLLSKAFEYSLINKHNNIELVILEGQNDSSSSS